MRVKVYAVKDAKAGNFGQPFFSINRATALRSFIEACQDKGSMLGKYPEDFALWELAEFDDASGAFVENDPQFLVNGATDNAS